MAIEKTSLSTKIPPVEIDKDNGLVYLADMQIPIGEHFESLEKERQNWLQRYTLDKYTMRVLQKVATGALNPGEPTLLEGPTAASKTSAIEYLASITGHIVMRVNLSGQTDTSDLIGKFVPNDKALADEFEDLFKSRSSLTKESQIILERASEQARGLTKTESAKIAALENIHVSDWAWQDGKIPRAMKEGAWIILDEMNLAEPQILERLNPVLENPPSLVLDENGGIRIGMGGEKEVHKDFRMFGTMNPVEEYTGRSAMSGAYKNRWRNYGYIESPNEEAYSAMLSHLLYGEQPKIQIEGEKYEAESSQAKAEYEKISKVPNMREFLAKLAAFHATLAKMAYDRDIGRDKEEKDIFTRRDLLSLLNFISACKISVRRTKTEKTIETHPVEVILKGLKNQYLDRIRGDEDFQKVQNLLRASGINEEGLREIFAVKEIREGTKKDMEGITKPKEEDESSETVEIPETMRKAIEANYKKQLKLWADKGILEKGTTHYLADYDGRKEEGGKGKDFTGEGFEIPTLKEIFEGLTETDVKNYMDMERRGLKPELLLVPIGKTIGTLAKTIGAMVNEKVVDHTLVYEPVSLDASNPTKLVTRGGKKKTQLIEENTGWMIKISPMKQVLDEIDTTGKPLPKKKMTNAEKTAHWHKEMNDMGLCGQDYETYIAAQASTEKPLEQKTGQHFRVCQYQITPLFRAATSVVAVCA
jgi:MoxR-like ATPase